MCASPVSPPSVTRFLEAAPTSRGFSSRAYTLYIGRVFCLHSFTIRCNLLKDNLLRVKATVPFAFTSGRTFEDTRHDVAFTHNPLRMNTFPTKVKAMKEKIATYSVGRIRARGIFRMISDDLHALTRSPHPVRKNSEIVSSAWEIEKTTSEIDLLSSHLRPSFSSSSSEVLKSC